MRARPMSLTLGLVLGTALVIGAQLAGSAFGDEEEVAGVSPRKLQVLEAQVGALQKQVEYLRSREAALTAYVLANDDRGASLQSALERARREGYLARAISSKSREALMKGLTELAADLRSELPAPTRAEARLRSQADAATAKAGPAAK